MWPGFEPGTLSSNLELLPLGHHWSIARRRDVGLSLQEERIGQPSQLKSKFYYLLVPLGLSFPTLL